MQYIFNPSEPAIVYSTKYSSGAYVTLADGRVISALAYCRPAHALSCADRNELKYLADAAINAASYVEPDELWYRALVGCDARHSQQFDDEDFDWCVEMLADGSIAVGRLYMRWDTDDSMIYYDFDILFLVDDDAWGNVGGLYGKLANAWLACQARRNGGQPEYRDGFGLPEDKRF